MKRRAATNTLSGALSSRQHTGVHTRHHPCQTMGTDFDESGGCLTIWMLVAVGMAESKPIHQTVHFESCYNTSRRLVIEVTDTLTQLQKNVSEYFNCTYMSVDVSDLTRNTINSLSACLPQTTICSNTKKIVLDEDKCLTAIHLDLRTFRNELQDVGLSHLPLMKITEEMMKIREAKSEFRAPKPIQRTDDLKEFGRKLRQCKAILWFQLRAITISRIFSYLKDEASKLHNSKRRF
ncbi:interleukin-12 subunit alpha [Gastrophryne carolinensis]